MYLIGNPYPSALDADEFIKDNIKDGGGRAASNIINGALYFWDHFGGTSHYLSGYVGGYATYTLMGGVVAISNDPNINNNGALGTKVPKKYIPVGQGFFIDTRIDKTLVTNNPNLTSITGGPVSLKNSQRAFKAKSPTESIFFKTDNANQNAANEIDARPRIRLQFDSPTGLHRQLLVGADSNTTNQYDLGYDAPMIDVNSDDMYWNFSGGKYVIQAISDFGNNQIIPIGFKITNAGESVIKIASLENIAADQEVYLFDAQTGLYHDLKTDALSLSLPIGDSNDRFSLRFVNETLSTGEQELNSGISIYYTQNDAILHVKNNAISAVVQSVHLFNILGQSVANYKLENGDQTNVQLPVKGLSTGTYIVKVITDEGHFSKKISIE